VVVLSAKTEERLVAYAQKLLDHLTARAEDTAGGHAGQTARLRDVAYTLQVGRNEMAERLALVAASVDELCAKLRRLTEAESSAEGLFRGTVKKGKKLEGLDQADDVHVDAVRQAMLARDLEALARLWVQGARIDWSALHRETPPERIALPTYPFERKRFWVGG
jgi:acyl transferase domain-containing protein